MMMIVDLGEETDRRGDRWEREAEGVDERRKRRGG